MNDHAMTPRAPVIISVALFLLAGCYTYFPTEDHWAKIEAKTGGKELTTEVTVTGDTLMARAVGENPEENERLVGTAVADHLLKKFENEFASEEFKKLEKDPRAVIAATLALDDIKRSAHRLLFGEWETIIEANGIDWAKLDAVARGGPIPAQHLNYKRFNSAWLGYLQSASGGMDTSSIRQVLEAELEKAKHPKSPQKVTLTKARDKGLAMGLQDALFEELRGKPVLVNVDDISIMFPDIVGGRHLDPEKVTIVGAIDPNQVNARTPSSVTLEKSGFSVRKASGKYETVIKGTELGEAQLLLKRDESWRCTVTFKGGAELEFHLEMNGKEGGGFAGPVDLHGGGVTDANVSRSGDAAGKSAVNVRASVRWSFPATAIHLWHLESYHGDLNAAVSNWKAKVTADQKSKENKPHAMYLDQPKNVVWAVYQPDVGGGGWSKPLHLGGTDQFWGTISNTTATVTGWTYTHAQLQDNGEAKALEQRILAEITARDVPHTQPLFSSPQPLPSTKPSTFSWKVEEDQHNLQLVGPRDEESPNVYLVKVRKGGKEWVVWLRTKPRLLWIK